jgi:hypothetical protein
MRTGISRAQNLESGHPEEGAALAEITDSGVNHGYLIISGVSRRFV